jgi:hypothetical protein
MRILRGFLKNKEFGLGSRQALRLQEQWFWIPNSSPPKVKVETVILHPEFTSLNSPLRTTPTSRPFGGHRATFLVGVLNFRIVASLDRKRRGAAFWGGAEISIRGVFDKEARWKSLAFAADAGTRLAMESEWFFLRFLFEG